MAVLVHAPTAKVLEDQDDDNQTEPSSNQSSYSLPEDTQRDDSPWVLKLNFPSMGELFIKILNNFVSSSTDEQLHDVCKKERSFAGFWYKALFLVITLFLVSRNLRLLMPQSQVQSQRH